MLNRRRARPAPPEERLAECELGKGKLVTPGRETRQFPHRFLEMRNTASLQTLGNLELSKNPETDSVFVRIL